MDSSLTRRGQICWYQKVEWARPRGRHSTRSCSAWPGAHGLFASVSPPAGHRFGRHQRRPAPGGVCLPPAQALLPAAALLPEPAGTFPPGAAQARALGQAVRSWHSLGGFGVGGVTGFAWKGTELGSAVSACGVGWGPCLSGFQRKPSSGAISLLLRVPIRLRSDRLWTSSQPPRATWIFADSLRRGEGRGTGR